MAIEFQRLADGRIAPHQHRHGYVAILLEGGYLEFGSTGRWLVEPGDLVSHRSFESHGNEIRASGARILNIAVPDDLSLPPVFQVPDPDNLIRSARRGEEFGHWLTPSRVRACLIADWPDILAARLREGPVRLAEWAADFGLAPETVSRGFRRLFGVGPARYRASVQAETALTHVRRGSEPLSAIAYRCGFADQAHLCRAIRTLTGRAPRSFRVNSIQD